LRLLYGYQWAHPGKKLLFMGGEFGQWREWSEDRSLDWHLLDEHELHQGVKQYVAQLNQIYRTESPLYAQDHAWEGFTWLDFRDSQRSILSFARHNSATGEHLLVACNFTPVVRHEYRLGVPARGAYTEILNSDDTQFGGSGVVNEGVFQTENNFWHDQPQSIVITLPPMGSTYIKFTPDAA
jgi:1,4-alpha-glucan branching enzyme